jgi:hypothetical protein
MREFCICEGPRLDFAAPIGASRQLHDSLFPRKTAPGGQSHPKAGHCELSEGRFFFSHPQHAADRIVASYSRVTIGATVFARRPGDGLARPQISRPVLTFFGLPRREEYMTRL